MLSRLIIGLLILAVIILLLRWFIKTPPKKVARVLRRFGIGTGIAVLIYLAATGRLHWLFALLGALVPLAYRLASLLGLIPLIQRLLALRQTMKSASGPAPGRSSDVETRFVRMSLDHDTGAMNGEVLEGRFKGRRLDELSLRQLLVLLDECRTEDEQSATLLEAYLERVHGDTWREQAAQSSEGATDSPGSSPITRDEAYEILGLSPGASAEEIIEAHRRLIQKLHPDRGGSTYLATQLNQAKEILLRK